MSNPIRRLPIVLVMMMALLFATACGGQAPTTEEVPEEVEQAAEEVQEAAEEAAEEAQDAVEEAAEQVEEAAAEAEEAAEQAEEEAPAEEEAAAAEEEEAMAEGSEEEAMADEAGEAAIEQAEQVVEEAPAEEEAAETSGEEEAPEAPAEEAAEEAAAPVETDFPVLDDAANMQSIDDGNNTINYQTSASLADIAQFYQEALTAQGLAERTVTTVINDQVVNLVFDGAESGRSIVVQAFPLDENTRNVSVRYEEI